MRPSCGDGILLSSDEAGHWCSFSYVVSLLYASPSTFVPKVVFLCNIVKQRGLSLEAASFVLLRLCKHEKSSPCRT